MRRETPAFAQQKWPGGTLYHYGFCEVAQRQAVSVRKNKSPSRAIKSDRAKVVMTAGCISETADITTFIYQMCHKAPAFRHGDIRHVHRICVSN